MNEETTDKIAAVDIYGDSFSADWHRWNQETNKPYLNELGHLVLLPHRKIDKEKQKRREQAAQSIAVKTDEEIDNKNAGINRKHLKNSKTKEDEALSVLSTELYFTTGGAIFGDDFLPREIAESDRIQSAFYNYYEQEDISIEIKPIHKLLLVLGGDSYNRYSKAEKAGTPWERFMLKLKAKFSKKKPVKKEEQEETKEQETTKCTT